MLLALSHKCFIKMYNCMCYYFKNYKDLMKIPQMKVTGKGGLLRGAPLPFSKIVKMYWYF